MHRMREDAFRFEPLEVEKSNNYNRILYRTLTTDDQHKATCSVCTRIFSIRMQEMYTGSKDLKKKFSNACVGAIDFLATAPNEFFSPSLISTSAI